MKSEFGRHYIADLYLCQEQLWESPREFIDKVRAIAELININNIKWYFESVNAEWVRISFEFNDSMVLLHIFPMKKFLTVDVFSWQSQFDIQFFSEGLIELFNPQVIAAESRLRGEHLKVR